MRSMTVVRWVVAGALLSVATGWSGSAVEEGGMPSPESPGAAGETESAPPAGLTAGDWSGIRSAHQAARLAARRTADGYEMRNPGQRWVTRFDGVGFTTTPDAGGWTWGLALERYGFPGSDRSVTTPAEVRAAGQEVAYGWDGTLEELYVNGPSGLEHGYTIAERPPGAEGTEAPLRISLAVRGELAAEVSEDGLAARFVDASGSAVVCYGGLSVRDARGAQVPARMVARSGGLEIEVDERDARYPLTVDPVAQQAYLKASNTDKSDKFGGDVAISGDTLVVGAAHEQSAATGVNGDQSDNTADLSGAAYVFVRSGSTWTQQAYLKASNTERWDTFAGDVAISGDTVVVSTAFEDSAATGVNGDQSDNSATQAGAVYVFVRTGTTWSQQAYIKASNTETFDFFGTSVALSCDTLVVGASGEESASTGVNGDQADNSADRSGAAYVFVRSGTTWSQQAYLKASNTGAYDLFGASVAISGDTVVVGASNEGSAATGVNGDQADDSAKNAGAAYVFVRNGTTWTQQAYLKASNTDAFDIFGSKVSICGDTLVVGAQGEEGSATGVDGDQADNSAINSGAAYVFVRNGTTWTQQAYLKASNTDLYDYFGNVVISGDTLVVGAGGESSSAAGVDGDQSDNSLTNAGAAYVFARRGTTWAQVAYLKASNPDAFDSFGGPAISGDTLLVGASGESSSATGVNGNQGDDSTVNAGAAYVFDLPPGKATFRNAGGNPTSYVAEAPVLALPWTGTVDLTTTGHSMALVFGYGLPTFSTLPGGQVLLCIPSAGQGELLQLAPRPGPVAVFDATVPADPGLVGFTLCTQALHFGGVQPFALSNAYDLTIGVH